MVDPRILGRLEEMLDTGKTPEEVCRECPELVTEVRDRWEAFRLIDAAVVDLLPGLRTAPLAKSDNSKHDSAAPPQVPGFEFDAEVGRGGMGVVYRARDLSLHRDVAVKLLQDNYPPDSPIARRFTDEAKITAQLQHPGVPAVYHVGSLPDGRPFLAMKLIKGRTLAALLAERPEVAADRGRFVAIFEDICQAVAYAHSLRVIHRDLKPSNVMVGKFGEVQVMDWGLAKVLTPAGTPVPANGGSVIRNREFADSGTRGGSGMSTRAGSILGTPAYMAPEQSGGDVDRLDTPCDVFGLGAILCEILTGQPPYVGREEDQILRQAMRAELADAHDRLAECGADPELVTLSLKCMAPDARDRPRDAGEVAAAIAALRSAAEDRARRAELDQVRVTEQGKRRRVLLGAGTVIVAALLLGLSASLWQMFRAIDAERQATKNLHAEQLARQDEAKAREQAFAALRSMTTEVIARKFAQGTALTDDDRAFLRGIIAQFDAFAAIKGEDPESRALQAEGRYRVGVIRHRLGELREAENDFDEAVAIQKQLAAELPARPEFGDDLARSLNARGILRYAMGRLVDAEQDYDQALTIRLALPTDFASRVESREQLARCYNSRAALKGDTGRLDDAVRDFDTALSIRERLAADYPDRPELRDDLAAIHNNRGRQLIGLGRPAEAEHDYNLAVGIQRQLAADFPARPEFRQNLARSYIGRGALLTHTGRPRDAEKDYDQAVGLQRQLAADFPARPEYRQDLAASQSNRGVLLMIRGQLADAAKDFDEALSIRRRLAADFPERPDLRNDLASTFVNLAVLQQQKGNWAASKQPLMDGRPHHLAALKANPRHLGYRQVYRNQLLALAAAHAGLLEPNEAMRTAETRRDVGWDPPADAFDAARILSLCAPIVARHDKLDAKQREDAARFYGDAAIDLLRQAISKGFTNLDTLKKDTDFDSIRQRDNFRALVAELEKKGKPALP